MQIEYATTESWRALVYCHDCRKSVRANKAYAARYLTRQDESFIAQAEMDCGHKTTIVTTVQNIAVMNAL